MATLDTPETEQADSTTNGMDHLNILATRHSKQSAGALPRPLKKPRPITGRNG